MKRRIKLATSVMAALAMLELQGRAVQVGGMNYVSARRPHRVAEVGA